VTLKTRYARSGLGNRSAADACIVVRDRRKGLADAIAGTWPRAVVQTCVLDRICNAFRFAARQHWNASRQRLRYHFEGRLFPTDN